MGPNSGNILIIYDSYLGVIHALEGIIAFKNKVDKVFTFQLKDSLSPTNEQFWGRWELLTNEEVGLVAKPRYYTFINI